ncbi:MAG TPA: ABC transporter substrate-binding protein [Lachnospiraceae bacterium]|nr:ABC transporter substrate-binding protein [Lachnospiraceae bacterium]
MKKKGVKDILLVSVLLTLTIALSACSGDKAGGESTKETKNSGKVESNSSKIIIGIPQDLEDSLDPHKAVAAGTKEVFFNIYEGLVKPDSDGNLIPAVAKDYAISPDGKTYIFYLREGIKFHDGSTVTVEDVKFSIDKCADTSNASPLVPAFSNIESTNIMDDSTVEIILKEPNTDFLTYMTTAIIPASNKDPDGISIGTGPYKYVSRSPQENFMLEKFDDYWGTPANIEHVTLKIISDADMIVTNLKGGSVDMICRITTAQAAELDEKDFDVLEGTMNLVQAMYLNNSVEPFTDIRVRKALCYAIDPKEIMLYISDGKGTEIGSSMFPSFGKYFMEELNDVYNQDITKAKELLTEAGYSNGFSFTITVPSNYQQHVDTAQVLAQEFKEIGVIANINLVEWDTWLSEVYADRDYEATVIGVDASSLTAGALLERFTSSSSGNFINYKNDAYDIAFENAASSTDIEQQTKYYKECQRILAEDAANVYIQDMASMVAINKKFSGYVFYPLYVQDFAKLYVVE